MEYLANTLLVPIRCIIVFYIYVILQRVLCIFPPHVHVYIRAYDSHINTRVIPNNTKHMHDSIDQKQQQM
jgi:hypothetical protein